MKFLPPHRLSPQAKLLNFNCGNDRLDIWLKKHSSQANQSGGSVTYLLYTDDFKLAGFYSIATSSVLASDATPRIRQGMGSYQIPVVLLTRLAVDVAFQGRGLGKALLGDCVVKSMVLSEFIGIRAIVTHPIDLAAYNFYSHYDFEESPMASNQLMILLKDARKNLMDSLS